MSDKAIRVLREAWENVDVDGEQDSALVEYLLDKVMAEGEGTYVTGVEILDLVANLVLDEFKRYEKPKDPTERGPIPNQGIYLGATGTTTLLNVVESPNLVRGTLEDAPEYPFATDTEWFNATTYEERVKWGRDKKPFAAAEWCTVCSMWHEEEF